ncbi:MAG: HD domain-containing protein, partial [Clostridia bacterium]|nr:HD domain-containing protein [Clostridia bacterium]
LFVGSDQLLSFHTWKNAAFLLSHVTLCAMSRDGEREAMEGKKRELEKEFGARLLLLKKKAYIISSSEARTELSREGLSLSLSPKVSEYVIRHGLYGSREKRGREQVLSLLESTLSPSRYSHTLSVERECARLCELLSYERKEALCLAALLHDRTKEWSLSRQLSYLEERSLLTDADRVSPAVLHGISAACLSLEEGLLEESEASAIRYHTTGRAGMTLGEKILYFADFIEETRPHEACQGMRHAFYHALPEGKRERRKHLDSYLLKVMENTRDHLQNRNQEIHPLTLEGIRALKERIKNDSH